MADDQPKSSLTQPEPVTPGSSAQVTPKFTRSYDEMNTGQMVFELQGAVGELKEAITNLTRAVETGHKRLETTEKATADIKDSLRLLTPKIDNLVGFATHAAPNFATKADIATLTAQIELRPTRWQSVGHMALLAGLVAAILAISAHVAV